MSLSDETLNTVELIHLIDVDAEVRSRTKSNINNL